MADEMAKKALGYSLPGWEPERLGAMGAEYLLRFWEAIDKWAAAPVSSVRHISREKLKPPRNSQAWGLQFNRAFAERG